MLCTRCRISEAITHTRFESYCESCSLDVALGLLSACRLSDAAIKALVASGWDMPVTTHPHYSATDIARELGVSAQKVGRVANAHKIKRPVYGEWRLDQAAHSKKQIETFWYNDQGRKRLLQLFEVTTK
jgi:hypothetical protein